MLELVLHRLYQAQEQIVSECQVEVYHFLPTVEPMSFKALMVDPFGNPGFLSALICPRPHHSMLGAFCWKKRKVI
uniref:Uncharacterized protein n=1 Tax=Arundo donax TaxID=35708 RepID=A0A0A9EPK3_ARUDO